MHRWLRFGLALVLMALPLAAAAAENTASQEPAEDARPNVIWILLDAMRPYNLSAYGYERPTSPNMDALAGEGVLFEQHYAQGLWTAISVPSYMTGRYFPVMVHDPVISTEVMRKPPEGERLLPEILRGNGYHTAMISAHGWFTESSRLWQAFDECTRVISKDPERVYYAPFEEVNETVFPWLEQAGEAGKPFFLYLHLLDTHFPHVLESPYDQWAQPIKSDQIKDGAPVDKYHCSFSTIEQNYLRGLHDGGILYADTHLGKLIEKLRALGLKENTILLVTADHGDMLGEDGKTWGHMPVSRDWIIQVPLIAAGPGLPEGKRVKVLTENADIVPSLVDLLELETDVRTDGRSFVPAVRSDAPKPLREFAFSKYVDGGYDGTPTFILRGNGFKYQRYLKDGSEHLWRVPDTAPERENILEEAPEAAARMRAYMDEHIMPRYEAYKALPQTAIYITIDKWLSRYTDADDAYVLHEHGENPETATDGKWGFDVNWGWLWAQSWQEDPPPLPLRYEVENGDYLLQAEMFGSPAFRGHPAGAMRFKVQDEAEFREVVHVPDTQEKTGFQYVDVGPCTVTDGTLAITVDNAGGNHWSVVRRFRLVEKESGAPAAPDAQQIEQLKALGYLE